MLPSALRALEFILNPTPGLNGQELLASGTQRLLPLHCLLVQDSLWELFSQLWLPVPGLLQGVMQLMITKDIKLNVL
jgi:hypothetical protein